MREISVDYIKGEDFISYWSSDPTEIRYMRGLAEKHKEVTITQDDQSDEPCMGIRVPSSWYRRPKPPAKRNLTEEQKEASRIRLANARKQKNES